MIERRRKILRGPFRGASTYLDWKSSKRKVFGLYEHDLNRWLEEKISKHHVYVDIGANNGYHTYGFAWAAKQAGHKSPRIIAVEPVVTPQLTMPMGWEEYVDCDIQIVEKFCGSVSDETSISLSDLLAECDEALVKVDIEGAEADLFDACPDLPGDPRFDWCIEIHGDELIPRVAGVFCRADRSFLLRELTPLPFLGGEPRRIHTTWLTTI